MSPRLEGLGHVLRQQPYELALAAALVISSVASLSAGRPSQAAARVLPGWALRPVAVLLVVGGALTIAGLITVGAVLNDMARVLARRVEQAGQVLMCGVLAAVALGLFSLGLAGVTGGSVYLALGAASGVRAALIGHTFNVAGRERTDLE